MADNPWATTTTSAIAENLGVFIFDERSGRTQAVEVEGVESVAVQTKFEVESVVLAPTDPNFANVSLLLHMDGSNGSTTFTDSSSNALAMTVSGSTALSTGQVKYGSASGGFISAGKLTAPNSPVLSMNADFTIEFWVYKTGSTGPYDTVVSASDESVFMIRAGGVNPGVFPGGGSNIANTLNFTLNTWHHMAVVRNSGTYKVFQDGIDITTSTRTETTTRDFSGLIIGDSSVSGRYFVGYIDELRITKGIARYTANFTPPTTPFPNA
jgi:hypothetical protein